MSELPSVEPVWKALGYSKPKHAPHKPWLWVWSRTAGICGFRPSQLGSVNSLVAIHPDIEFWRAAFPYRRDQSGVDFEKARAVFVRLCFEAGEFTPPDGLEPRGRGRPRKTTETPLSRP